MKKPGKKFLKKPLIGMIYNKNFGIVSEVAAFLGLAKVGEANLGTFLQTFLKVFQTVLELSYKNR